MGSGVPLSTQMHQGYIFRWRSHRAPTKSWQESLTTGKGIYRAMQNSVGWKKEGKKRRRVRGAGSASGDWGSWSRGEISTSGQSVRTEGKHLRLSESETVDPWHWMEWEPHRQSMPWSYVPWTVTQVTAGSRSVGNGEQFQGKDCCWLWGDGLRW